MSSKYAHKPLQHHSQNKVGESQPEPTTENRSKEKEHPT